jgi:hypothetical protein
MMLFCGGKRWADGRLRRLDVAQDAVSRQPGSSLNTRLDPASEAARMRAFYVHPQFARLA